MFFQCCRTLLDMVLTEVQATVHGNPAPGEGINLSVAAASAATAEESNCICVLKAAAADLPYLLGEFALSDDLFQRRCAVSLLVSAVLHKSNRAAAAMVVEHYLAHSETEEHLGEHCFSVNLLRALR